MSEAPKVLAVPMPAAVGWFGLRQLLGTGLQALVTAAIGTRSARREVLAALDTAEARGEGATLLAEGGYFDFAKADVLWVDYVADLGDGFDATHSIAWLVGRDRVFLGTPGEEVAQPVPEGPVAEAPAHAVPGAPCVLEGGDVLVLGGDLTYPVASQENYLRRTVTPYAAARPWDLAPRAWREGGAGRALLAIPGNHDWYDGLSAFIRLFCQPGRWVGAWEVQQRRSYVAARLPHGFWLWGVDTATETDIDPPQMAFFERQARHLSPGDRVVLCVPKPAWTGSAERPEGEAAPSWEPWGKLATVIALATARPGVAVPLVLSGDLHHYTRYEADGAGGAGGLARHYVTCGGGGAFLVGTARAPGALRLPGEGRASLRAAFPSREDSERMRRGVWRLPLRHPSFCAALAATMLALVWLVQSASRGLAPSQVVEGPLLATLRDAGPLAALRDLGAVLAYAPLALVAAGAVAAGFWAFAASGAPRRAPPWAAPLAGLVHALAHLAVALLLALGVASAARGLLAVPLALLLGLALHGLVVAGYLRLANLAGGFHEMELYSSQAIQGWKGFLRMRIGPEGLTLYPVGLREVSPWRGRAPGEATLGALARRLGASLTVPVPHGATQLLVPEGRAPRPHLIEAPIHLPPGPRGDLA